MRIRRLLLATLVLAVVAILGWIGWAATTTAPRAISLSVLPVTARTTVVGAYHIHSVDSDGTGTAAEIAAAAERAGLDFIILTDHGDGTRPVKPPQYYGKVLCLEEVEVSTSEGHYAVLGMPVTPYPLGGDARDVVEDVYRLGGFGIAAHPDSAKPDLQWKDWTAPIAGLEWFNGDSEWRDEKRGSLPPVLIRYFVRPAESIASVYDRPADTIARWDRLSQHRPVVALAGHDAHQRLGLRATTDPYQDWFHLKFPSYESEFRSFALRVELLAPLTHVAAADARALIAAIRHGQVYTGFDALAAPVSFSIRARVGEHEAYMGDRVALTGPISLHVRSNAPASATIRLFRNGQQIDARRGNDLDWFGDQPGTYRAEVGLPGAPGRPPIPWVFSNPIYIGIPESPAPPIASVPQVTPWPEARWTIEKDPSSDASIGQSKEAGSAAVTLSFELGPDRQASPYAAGATPMIADLRTASRLAFRLTADRPMRVSIQLRERTTDPDRRWRRSVYADQQPRTVVIPLSEFRPVEPGRHDPLDPARIATLLVVVDTVNAHAGSVGNVTIDQLHLER
jgi:hypothetical protein